MPLSPVSIVNGNFQSPVLGEGSFVTGGTGWTASGSAGIWNPPSTSPLVNATGTDQVGFANAGASLSQNLAGVTVTETGIVQITMEIHGRLSVANYSITLSVGGTPIAAIAQTGASPASGQMQVITFTFNMANIPNVATLVGQQVGLVIRGVSGGQLNFDDVTAQADPGTPICFCGGTRIETSFGYVTVETLKIGDLVKTLTNGLQPIRWIGHLHYTHQHLQAHSQLRPIRIPANRFGLGLPLRDLSLSRQHRLLIDSSTAKQICGNAKVLIAAHHMTEFEKVELVMPKEGVDYYHLLFDQHEVILAEAIPCESLLLGPEALRTLPKNDQHSFRAFVSNPSAFSPRYPIPSGKMQKHLLQTLNAKACPLWRVASATPKTKMLPKPSAPSTHAEFA